MHSTDCDLLKPPYGHFSFYLVCETFSLPALLNRNEPLFHVPPLVSCRFLSKHLSLFIAVNFYLLIFTRTT